MLWKILSALTALVLGAALFFSWKDQGQIKEERNLEEHAKRDLNDTRAKKEEAAKVTETKTKELGDRTKDRDDTRIEITKVLTDKKQKEDELVTLTAQLAETSKQLTLIEEQIKKAGNIKVLLADVTDLTEKVKTTEAAIANWQQQQALTEEGIAKVETQVKHYREVDARQRRGQVEPEFTARISRTVPEFNFVVLNKGNAGGVYANAILNVKRGKEIVAKLRVRNVEQSAATADIVPGSISANDGPRSGDLVVAAPLPPAPPAETSTAPAGAPPAAGAPATPMGAPIMGADPFGGGAAPAGAPPATAPAPMAPAGADPFGAAPAPVTPPPAAGGAKGTPEKPSTADPFTK